MPQKAWIKYGGDEGSPAEFGSGSESPMGGPVYRFDADLDSSVKFPQSLDGKFFAAEYGRKWIKPITVNADGSPAPSRPSRGPAPRSWTMAFGPDGALYVLDYGTGADNQALYRIEYVAGTNRNPVAVAAADKTSGRHRSPSASPPRAAPTPRAGR